MPFSLSPAQIQHAANLRRLQAALLEVKLARAAAKASGDAVVKEAAAKEKEKLKIAMAGKPKAHAVMVK